MTLDYNKNVFTLQLKQYRLCLFYSWQKLRGQQSIAIDDPSNEPAFLLQEWLGGGPKREEGNASDQDQGHKYLQPNDSQNIDSRNAQEQNKEIDEKGCSHADLTSFEFHSKETYPYRKSSIAVKQHEAAKPKDKRVTIHLKSRDKDLSKLIILPASIEELLKLAGKETIITHKDFNSIPNFSF